MAKPLPQSALKLIGKIFRLLPIVGAIGGSASTARPELAANEDPAAHVQSTTREDAPEEPPGEKKSFQLNLSSILKRRKTVTKE